MSEHYRNFKIEQPLAGPQYGFAGTHVDYDGPEDDRFFIGMSVAEVKEQIDLWHEEQDEFNNDITGE